MGPDFRAPKPPHTSSYTARPLALKTVQTSTRGSQGKAQQFIYGKDLPADWWTLFHSPEINDLIQAGLEHNQTLQAAMANLNQAEEMLNVTVGKTLFPYIYAGGMAERQRFAPGQFNSPAPPSTFNVYNANINAAYTLDVFGGGRRLIEATAAQVDYQFYEMQAAYLTLTTNIVTTAITIASLEDQIQATRDLIQSQEKTLQIVNQQFQLGAVSRSNVLLQQTQLAQTIATLPPLEKNLALQQDALSVLIGTLPSDSRFPKVTLYKLHLPNILSLSLPSRLVRQRPDIQASEALLHAAFAQIGVATANLLPQITLNGLEGWTSNKLSLLFTKASNVWSITGTALQPIFQGGALLANRRAAIAAMHVARAQYQQTVLVAFQNVADALHAIDEDAKLLKAQQAAETAAQQTLVLTRNQFKLGSVNYLSLLNAQQQYQNARIARIQAAAARYTDTAVLFYALGGGWWNQHDKLI